ERLADAADPEHVPAARRALPEPELRVPSRAAGQLLEVLGDPLDHAQLALRLPRLAVLRAEPVDELLVMCDLLLPRLDLAAAPLPLRFLVLQELRVVAVIERDRLVVDVEDLRRDVVEEPVVVGDDDRGSGEPLEKLLEPADRQ